MFIFAQSGIQGLPNKNVFNSSGATTGNAGGRSGMNAICAATDPALHFCTHREIYNAFVTTGVYFSLTNLG